MKSKQADDVILLKQKIIYLQSELARYKAKAYAVEDASAIQMENERLKEELEKVESKIRELMKQVEQVMAENVILKELALQSEQRYEELEKVKREKEELERKLAEFRPHAHAEEDESWFLHTLRQQNAIAKNQKSVQPLSFSSPFSFGEGSEEK